MSFATILDTLTTIIWSPALVFVCLAVGIFFTISTLFMQIRCIPDMFQQMVGNDDSESGVSSFKALMISLAGRVGVGNIAGVATAIAYGGPGAVFWMWIVAIFGAATSFMECTLAQIYKEKDQDTGEYRGGRPTILKNLPAHAGPKIHAGVRHYFRGVHGAVRRVFPPGHSGERGGRRHAQCVGD